MEGKMDKEKTAIMRLQTAAELSLTIYQKPLIITISGGKDSSVCLELAMRAGIPFEVMHSHTTVDAPETVYFVRQDFKRLEEKRISCAIRYPIYKGKRTSMWNLIPQKRYHQQGLRGIVAMCLKKVTAKEDLLLREFVGQRV